MASISKGDKYYWAKALSLKGYTAFYGVKFSNDGSILIAHTDAGHNYIVAFNVITGNILTAR
jgi:hypothetical protein